MKVLIGAAIVLVVSGLVYVGIKEGIFKRFGKAATTTTTEEILTKLPPKGTFQTDEYKGEIVIK